MNVAVFLISLLINVNLFLTLHFFLTTHPGLHYLPLHLVFYVFLFFFITKTSPAKLEMIFTKLSVVSLGIQQIIGDSFLTLFICPGSLRQIG